MKIPDVKLFVRNLFCGSPEVVSYEALSSQNGEKVSSVNPQEDPFFGFRVLLIALRKISLNAEKRTFVRSAFKDLFSNQSMLSLRPDTNNYVNIR